MIFPHASRLRNIERVWYASISVISGVDKRKERIPMVWRECMTIVKVDGEKVVVPLQKPEQCGMRVSGDDGVLVLIFACIYHQKVMAEACKA